MCNSADFFRAIVDSVTEHIAVIDQTGQIQFVNTAWLNFGVDNECKAVTNWHEINYLSICDSSAASGEEFGKVAGEGIRRVIRSESDSFCFEYPCDSDREKRWFLMRAIPLKWEGDPHYVVSHQNVTDRKLAEEKLQGL
jgi:hypothetical protein